jgi:hypothetical protein
MSLPLPTLGFYRLPDQAPAAATINALLDAVYAALTQTTDVFSVALPTSAKWTWAKDSPAGTTQAVYTTALPSGTPLTRGLSIIFAGKTGAPTPQMLLDTFVASNLMQGYGLNTGLYAAWDAVSPFTSGVFTGYNRVTGTSFNVTTATVRAYVSSEVIFIDFFTTASLHTWLMIGALMEPLTSDTVNDAETDNRIYGMWTTGAAGTTGYTLNSTTVTDPWVHSASAGQGHFYISIPGTLNSGATGLNTCQYYTRMTGTATGGQWLTPSGAVFLPPLWIGKVGVTQSYGRARECYQFGSKQGGLTYTLAGTPKFHVISRDTSTNVDAYALKCP